ncbi:PIR protein CIR protein [Plasmodium vinckei petteri]|uniref:PIR protein CIR protein n=1 Tax=Plasmodium vinckei petteri TaxID=138298 RepID=A0A6V7SD69_PLAVN|nr:PIR protein CIR protein [Plasmodium vinckei petteri]
MGIKACEIFNDIDALFIDYETNEEQFNDDNGLYNKYCPIKSGSKRCKTNYEKLSAISRHAYTELMQNENVDLDSENDLHGDFLIMGLSNKLYNISKDHSLSLKDSFGKYLGNSIGSFNHHSILYNKKYYMGYNIGVMNGFYLLFKQICETINISEKPNAQQHEYINSVTQCLIMYDKLYDFVNQCDPYLQLLYHLKTIYNDLIDAVIKANGNDESLRSKLIKLSSIDKTTFGSEFNTKGCKKVNKKFEQNISKIANKSQEEQDEQDELSTLIELLGSDDDDDDGENGDDAASTDGTDDADTQTDISSGLVNSQDKYDTQGNEQKDSDDGQVSQPASSNGETGSGTDTGAGGTGSGTVGGSDNGAGTGLGSVQGGASGGSGINHQGTNGGTDSQGSIDSGSSSQGGTGNGTGDGTKVSGDQATKHSSGASDGYLSNLWRTRLSPMNYIPSIPDIYETPKNILASTANKITSAYSNTVDNIKYAYDRTVDSVTSAYNSAVTAAKNAYTTSTNYISGAVSSITDQLSSLGTFSQLGDDQPELGGSGNSLPTENNPPSTTPIPNPDPNPLPPSSPSSPSLPSSPSPLSPVTSSDPQTPSPKSLDPQPISTQNSKSSDQQSTSTAGKGISQIPLPAQVTLASFGTSTLNIGNGNNPSGTYVKINEKPSIWCIGSNKKCDILSIGIISISIFAFLTIMYKYISFGSVKTSKKKKSMKRVIKYGDGTRKTQIIIKSYDRNKDLKPVINSVSKKKDPLLNIYKLMQADPVPFINLFFLLIFFVYKKKLNYLEL